MGCGLSRQEKEEDVVAMCRERKRLMKLALQRRYTFAEAYGKYNQSLYAVSMAIRLFVARHSCPSSPFFITFHSKHGGSALLYDPKTMYHQKLPSKSLHETIDCRQSNSEVDLAPSLEKQEKEDTESDQSGSDNEVVCEHFYDDMCEDVVSPKKEFEWDFFNPFEEMRPRVLNVFSGSQSCEEDVNAVREKEGIPELEEDNVANDSKVAEVKGNEDLKDNKRLKVIDDRNENGRELLEALKDVEDHFLRAYNSGLEVSRMLEANRAQFQSDMEAIKESSRKHLKSITWSRTTSSRSSSGKSLLSSTSMSSSMRADSKIDLIEDDGMVAGSHSLTLGRLYAWEKKLYQEVKAGDQIRRAYERKFSRLKSHDAMDKSRAEVNELHAAISITVRSAETISGKIHKLRDEELQPQLLELLHGLMRNWKIMMELHRTQSLVMLEVKPFNTPAFEKFSNESHRLSTFQLQVELDNWRSHLAAYVSTQKAYIGALNDWVSKFLAPETEFYWSVSQINWPKLLITCQNWLACIENLPDKDVTYAMKSLIKDCRALWNQQEEEQQQKEKVDRLAKELDTKSQAFQRAEKRVLECKISDQDSEGNVRNHMEYLAERKNEFDMYRNKLEEEKQKHLKSIKDTQRITVDTFQTGFSLVFESLAEFSRMSVKLYAHVAKIGASEQNTAETNMQ